jgi:hemolysin III
MSIRSSELSVPGKPLLRGWSHVVAFVVAAALCGVLVGRAPGGLARVTAIIYLAGLCAMFGVSSLFHRIRWSPAAHAVVGRIDHSAIFAAIAGTYTPVAVLALDGWARVAVLAIVWGGTVIGVTLAWSPIRLPRWLFTAIYALVGWALLAAVPQLPGDLGWLGLGLLGGGGVAYTLGAVVYATRRPDPWPRVFGFHELFHACTLVGVGTHLAAISFVVLPLAA